MRPRGCNSATRAAGRSWRTIVQKTFCSRTRRAMSWPYCAPKSRIRMRSLSGRDIVGDRLFNFVGELGEQFVQRRFIVHVTVRHEPLDLDMDLITVVNELN